MKQMMAGATLAMAVGMASSALACDECQLRKDGLYMGQYTLMGNGTLRSWVKYEKGKPTSLGVTFSEKALSGLKTNLPAKMPVMEYQLALPKEAKITGFDHISLDWAPLGHVPKGVYDKPHFDIHFYLMSPAERQKITAVGKDLAICSKKPEARFIPAGYLAPPDTSIPMMGMHAIDSAAPELKGQPFEKTFLYGYYNGTMNFVEPMVALDYLKTKPNFSTNIKLPASYPKAGFYPTRYSIRYDATREEYSVSLDGLMWRGGVKNGGVKNAAPARVAFKAPTR
jgi:hypothetical protein